MVFELLHAPLPEGYGEALVPLATAKAHLGLMAEDTGDDELVAIFRDAAIEFVESYCGLYLGPRTGLIWQAESFPVGDTLPLHLGRGPVTAITAISWLDSTGATVAGTVGDYRAFARGDVIPAIGKSWASDVGGGVQITFSAGFAEGACPGPLLHAVRMFLGHLWLHREAILTGTIEGEISLGVRELCRPYRRLSI